MRDDLTPSEFNLVHAARQEWRASLVSTGTISTKLLQKVVSQMYLAINLPPPKIYRFGSPLSCILSIPYLSGLHGTGYYESAVLKILKGPSLNTLGTRLNNARDRQGDSRWDRLGDLLRESMALPIRQQVTDEFIENFQKELAEATGGKCRPDKVDILADCYLRLMENGTQRSMTNGRSRIEWWTQTAGTGMYWWPYRGFAVVSEYPSVWHRSPRDVPHHDSEAAIQFPDGYRIWVWLGQRVTAQIIAFPETITVQQVRSETNAEIQRVMISRMGAGRYLNETHCELVDMDSLTLEGSAPRALMRDDLGNMWLVGTDGSTARVYTMSVPPDVRSCKEAHQRISGFDEKRLIAEA